MADRRKNKKKKEIDIKTRGSEPSKEEYAIAKYLKAKLPEKKTTLLGHKVEYLIASKAVDCLLESPWAKPDKKSEIYFTNRESAVEFMEKLLIHKFFHRAKKIVVQRDPKKKKKDAEETVPEPAKEKEPKKSTKGKVESGDKVEEKGDEKKEVTEVVEKKKEKKKIKLDMHLEQIFVDSNEPYVWIYDPIPMRTWIIGSLMVVGAVLVCLFPLWPQTIRHYIYYLSVAAAFFLAFIIGLAVLRFIVFILIWVLTFGKHHLWLLPNLTEDVGFFESFWPLYKYEYKGNKDDKKEKESSKETQQKDKGEEEEEEKEKNDQDKSDSSSDQEHKTDDKESKEDQEAPTESEHESEEEKAKDDNGFELVEAEEEEEESEIDAEDRKTK